MPSGEAIGKTMGEMSPHSEVEALRNRVESGGNMPGVDVFLFAINAKQRWEEDCSKAWRVYKSMFGKEVVNQTIVVPALVATEPSLSLSLSLSSSLAPFLSLVPYLQNVYLFIFHM